MSILDMFTPEGMLRAMGVKPEEMIAEYQRLAAILAEINADRLAFKDAFRLTTEHFNARLIMMDMKLDRILSILDKAEKTMPGGYLNGAQAERKPD